MIEGQGGGIGGYAAQDNYGHLLKQQSAANQQYAQLGAVPPTLMRAMSTLEVLEKRLFDISARAHKLATVIGGPIPVQVGNGINEPNKPPPTVMQRLNDQADRAVQVATEISSALEAVSRSLGVANQD